MKKITTIFEKILRHNKQPQVFRKVYFGLRIRFLLLLSLVMIVIISLISLILYYHQKEVIANQKTANAQTITKILSSPAELFLDTNIENTPEERTLKKILIRKEISNFKAYNNDIVDIIVTNYRGQSIVPTTEIKYRWDYKMKHVPSYIKKGLKLEEDKLYQNEFTVKNKKSSKRSRKRDKDRQRQENRSNNQKAEDEKLNYLAIVYPIFLKSGLTVKVLEDFEKYYKTFHEPNTSPKSRRIIYKRLYRKYKIILGEDFDPAIQEKKRKEAAKKDPQANNENDSNEKKVEKIDDIDFLFHSLFLHVMKLRSKKFDKAQYKYLNDAWVFRNKKLKLQAYENDLPAKAKKLNDEIVTGITKLAENVEMSRRLGTIAVIFNVQKQEREQAKLISNIIIPNPFNEDSPFVIGGFVFIAILFGIIAIAFILVLNFMIKNLKKLEIWAMTVANGNLDDKIEITSHDEIGRLGDVFNHMLDQIIFKFHLEKFVSSSTKNMITSKKKSVSGVVDLGVTGRKNYAFIFSDVRGFTSFSEKNDPETVIQVLNFYLALQSKIIKAAKGDIDDYVGDEIMAHFGGEKRADTAIQTAIKMMEAVKKANKERAKKGLPIFEVGIGVHGGDVVVGNVGSDFRMDFTCVGDAVNLSSRLCSSAGPGDIIVSKELFKDTTGTYKTTSVPALTLKGKAKKIPVVKIKL